MKDLSPISIRILCFDLSKDIQKRLEVGINFESLGERGMTRLSSLSYMKSSIKSYVVFVLIGASFRLLTKGVVPL